MSGRSSLFKGGVCNLSAQTQSGVDSELNVATVFPEHHDPNNNVQSPGNPIQLPPLPLPPLAPVPVCFVQRNFALTSHPLWELAPGLMRPVEAAASDYGAGRPGPPPRPALGPRVFAGQK